MSLPEETGYAKENEARRHLTMNHPIVRPQKQSTFFDNVKSQLAAPVFAANLKHAAPGSYDFGHIDRRKYRGWLTYTPVNSFRGFWGFTADSYMVGDGYPVSNPFDAIAGKSWVLPGSEDTFGLGERPLQGLTNVSLPDTGTTLLLMSDAVVADYYSQVEGAQLNWTYGGYVFPCSTYLPSFTVTINGYDAVVPGYLINFAALPSWQLDLLWRYSAVSPSALPFSATFF